MFVCANQVDRQGVVKPLDWEPDGRMTGGGIDAERGLDTVRHPVSGIGMSAANTDPAPSRWSLPTSVRVSVRSRHQGTSGRCVRGEVAAQPVGRLAVLDSRALEHIALDRQLGGFLASGSAHSVRFRSTGLHLPERVGPGSPTGPACPRAGRAPGVTRALGLPVSRTIRTTPCLNSRWKFRRSIVDHFL